MVVNLELSYDIENLSSLVLIQKIIMIIQQQVYRMEGSLNKVVAYDIGFTVIACWGLSPYSHDDDAARAVFAAQNIQRKINRIGRTSFDSLSELPIHIGVSTGSVFMGIIGNEGGRKEIVILGEAIERAFLLMQTATRVYGKIFVDHETKVEASLFIDFRYQEHVEFANKFTNHPIFEPLDSITISFKPIKTQDDLYRNLRLHANPFALDYNGTYQNTYCNIYGMQSEPGNVLDQIASDLSDYAANPESSIWILAIKGELGAGKSLFARALLEKISSCETQILQRRNEIQSRQSKERLSSTIQFNFSVTTCNAEVSKRFLGVWIPVLRQILSLYSVHKGTKVEFMLNRLIKSSKVSNKVSLIEEIFGIRGLQREIEQIVIVEDPNSFFSVQSYPKDVEDDILSFIHSFFREAVSELRNEILFVLTIDNASLMDRSSWHLLYLLTSACDQMVIVLCLISLGTKKFRQSQEKQFTSQNFQLAQQSFEFYRDNIGPFEQEVFNIFEVDPVGIYDLRQLLIDNAKGYQSQMKKEIHLVSQILDSKHVVKTYTTQTEVSDDLINYYQVNDFFIEVEKELISAVVEKCQGNPQLCISLVYQLLISGLLEIRERILLSCLNFRHAIKTKCWNDIQLPPLALKTNQTLIESIYQQNVGLRKLTTEKFVNAFQILKVASVIGEAFSMKQILAVSESLTGEKEHSSDVLEILEELEVRGLIEMVYEDGLGDIFFRFESVFLRETLFQLQIYEGQRKVTHGRIIIYLQDNMLYNWQTDWNIEKETIMFLQHLLLEQGVDSQRDLDQKGRKTFVIKKVNCHIAQNSEILKQGQIQYMKSKPKKALKPRHLILTQKALIWYKTHDDFRLKKQKGAINLDQIVRITEMKQEEGKKPEKATATQSAPQEFMVQIQCNEYYRKFKLKYRQKAVTLNMQSQREVEEWIFYIEYVKTKANLDIFNLNYAAFTLTSTRSKFPLSERHKMNQESFGHLIQREINQQKQLQEPILKQLQHQKNPSFTLRSQPTVTLTHHDAHNGILEVPESVVFLKNTLSSLYSVLTLKTISHLQTNACKSPLPSGLSPTPTHGDAHYILPTVGEENDSQLNYSFAQLPPVPQNETLQKNVSQISRIKRVADLRRSYGFPTGLDQTMNKQDSFQQEEGEDSDAEDNAGSQGAEETITGGRLSLRHRNSFIGEKGTSMTRNSRVSIKGDSSMMSMADKANKMDDFSNIENAVPQDPEESLMSFIEAKPILTFEEEAKPIEIPKVFLPLKGQLLKDGAIVLQLTSQKPEMNLPDLLQSDKPALKRRRQLAPQQSFQLSSSASVSHRHLLSHFQRQRAENSTALSRVLDKARVTASSSMVSMIVRKKSSAALMNSLPPPASADTVESKRRPSLLKGTVPHPRVEEDQLRKVRSVKSRVRFNDEEEKEGEGLARDESVMSIGQTMAIQEYQRFSSQRGREKEQVKTIQKHSNKIHKSSPSISRDQSRIYDEEALQHNIHEHDLNMSSTNEVDFCNVDDSEILDLQILATHNSLDEPIKVTGKSAYVKNSDQVRQEPGEMYVQEEIQCIVINNPKVKNLKLSRGTKVFVNHAISGLDVVQAMVLHQGDLVTVIVPAGILGRDLPKGVMVKPNLQIHTSTPSSLTQSQEDSKLLRQPSDQCIPKAVPNFNSFTTSRKSLVNDYTEQRSRPNPFHKFMQPIGHDSTVRSYQGDETINNNSRLDLLDDSSSLQIPEFTEPPSSKTSPPENHLEFTLSRPLNQPAASYGVQSDFESYLPRQDLPEYPTSQGDKKSPKEQDQETPTGFGPSSQSQPRLSRTQTMNRLMKMQMRKALKMAEKEREESQNPAGGGAVGVSLKVQERRMRRKTEGALQNE